MKGVIISSPDLISVALFCPRNEITNIFPIQNDQIMLMVMFVSDLRLISIANCEFTNVYLSCVVSQRIKKMIFDI